MSTSCTASRARHAVHRAANGLALSEGRTRTDHCVQQRHIAVITEDLDGLTRIDTRRWTMFAITRI
jgi:hypothetical protein